MFCSSRSIKVGPSIGSPRILYNALPGWLTRRCVATSVSCSAFARSSHDEVLKVLCSRTSHLHINIQLMTASPSPRNHLTFTKDLIHQGKATHSISTSTPFGNSLTATQLLAGFVSRKCNSYSLFTSAKFFISVRNTVIFTTLLRSLPASFRISWMFLIQREAL